MVDGVAPDQEGVRVIEVPGVTVAGAEQDGDLGTCGDHGPLDLHVPGGAAAPGVHRGPEAEHLVEDRRDQ